MSVRLILSKIIGIAITRMTKIKKLKFLRELSTHIFNYNLLTEKTNQHQYSILKENDF